MPINQQTKQRDFTGFISKRLQQIPSSGIRKLYDLLAPREGVVSLGVGEPDFITPWNIREAAINAIKEGRTSYTPNAGLLTLRQELARYLKENYSLVVVGDVFASKGGARQRMKRDFLGILSDHFRVPVLGMEELKARYLFGRKQLIDLLVFVAVSVVIYTVVFRFQEPILTFLSKGHFDEKLGPRIAASLAVALFTPIVALSMGGAYKNLLKLIKME